jgi:hypothetical protein
LVSGLLWLDSKLRQQGFAIYRDIKITLNRLQKDSEGKQLPPKHRLSPRDGSFDDAYLLQSSVGAAESTNSKGDTPVSPVFGGRPA